MMEIFMPPERLIRQLAACRGFIGYEPLRDEPVPELPFDKLNALFMVPADESVAPLELARRLSGEFAGATVCIYIPGTAFDAHGTRHGRGGGWYDRFLAEVPPQWVRVGFCFEKTFSHSPLLREPWDEPVDWVCVRTLEGMTCHETKARILT